MIHDYFCACETAEDAKSTYKKYCKILHPDCGGSTADFQELQRQFEVAFSRLKTIHVSHMGEKYTQDTDESADEFMDIIDILLHLHGVDVELCGSWLWITGDTKPYKDKLKSIGGRWSHNKKCWYIHRGDYHRYHSKSYSLDDIRNMYGSKPFSHHKDDHDNHPQIYTSTR